MSSQLSNRIFSLRCWKLWHVRQLRNLSPSTSSTKPTWSKFSRGMGIIRSPLLSPLWKRNEAPKVKTLLKHPRNPMVPVKQPLHMSPKDYSAQKVAFIRKLKDEGVSNCDATQKWNESTLKKDLLSSLSVSELIRRRFCPKGTRTNPWAWLEISEGNMLLQHHRPWLKQIQVILGFLSTSLRCWRPWKNGREQPCLVAVIGGLWGTLNHLKTSWLSNQWLTWAENSQ